MSTPEESPAQRAARLRRERREAKIKEGGSARLDKITSLNGRTAQSAREEASPSPQPAVSPSPSPLPQNRPSPSLNQDMPSAETLEAQQAAFRAMLRQGAPEAGLGQQPPDNMEDPTMKLLSSFLGGMPGDPNAPSPGAPGAMAEQAPGFTPADLAGALGLPPSLANMLGGASQQPTEGEQNAIRVWRTLHVVFALGVAIYLLFVTGASVAMFGSPPPKPATAQNPFLIFVTGELLLTGGRVLLGGKQGGLRMAVQLGRDVVRDGSLVLFALGLGAWYHREWQMVKY